MECIFSKQKLVSVLEIGSRKEALDRERKGEPPVCSREHSRTYLGGGKDSLKTVCVCKASVYLRRGKGGSTRGGGWGMNCSLSVVWEF